MMSDLSCRYFVISILTYQKAETSNQSTLPNFHKTSKRKKVFSNFHIKHLRLMLDTAENFEFFSRVCRFSPNPGLETVNM